MPFDLEHLLHAMTSVSEDALHGLTGCIRKHLTQGVQLSTEREKKKRQGRNEQIRLVSRTKYLNQEVNLRKKTFFFNSRYELIYGGEFRWTPGGQLSDVLQQKAKQFLRQTDISF